MPAIAEAHSRPENHVPAGSPRWVAPVVLGGLVAGAVAYWAGLPKIADILWAAATLVTLVPLGWSAGRQLLRGRTGVDAIALLAMAGALALGETLAGAVVALMLAGGEWLEAHADRRARSELSRLVERQPRTVERLDAEGRVETRPAAGVVPGDRLLVRSGEVVPVDGVAEGPVVLDTSALTGEAIPRTLDAGERIASGTVNAGAPFPLKVVATAAESTYAGIVRLVEQAQAARAPLVRLADRFAAGFLPLTLAVAGGAWAVTGDPYRALAVLVVATPCPLILATPIALMGGISRAAREGLIVKGGGALEVLSRAERLMLDKTGTLTVGEPRFVNCVPLADRTAAEVLRLAASLDQVSPHGLAAALVRGANREGLTLAFPADTREEHGAGIEGLVEGRRVRLGRKSWVLAETAVPPAAAEVEERVRAEALSAVWVAVDDRPAGVVLFEDPLRPEAAATLDRLRRVGLGPVTLLTGDHPEPAERVGKVLGLDRVLADQSPEDKVAAVRREAASGTVVMVGDGINDAAALAAADVGIAFGARGATAASEAAQVVLLVDRLDLVADAVQLARRSRAIALQSIWGGMTLSLVAMVWAAAGYLTPVAGAVVQEAIDVAAILNALRSLWGPATR